MLWCLYLAFVSISLGFFLLGLTLFLPINYFLAIHCFAYGGIGLSTLSMMARVSLGHSGRALEIGRPIVIAFLCINLSAAFRVFGVWLLPELTMRWFEISGLCWLLAFGIFVVIYTPILIRPRADGRDG